MALRGNLRDFSLPDVFQLVTFSRKTGVLRIKREDGAEGSVWFRDGEVFFASSNWHSEPLGERLVKAQRITPQALVRGLELRGVEPPEGRRLGRILIDEGYITEKVLESFVSDQIQDTIFDLMRWEEGEFDFEAMPEVVEEDIGLTVSIENIVMEGSRRLEEWGRIRKKIPSVDVVFKMATAPGEGTFEISLKPMEWQLLLMVDGTRSVAELAKETGRTDFEVARILYGLFSAGLLEFATDEEVARFRAEREEREAKLAVIMAERQAELKAEQDAALARETKLVEEARKRQESAQAVTSAPVAPSAAESAAEEARAAIAAGPTEVPEFLGGAAVAPTADDQAALEEFMGAVLEQPSARAAVPEVPEAPAAQVHEPYVPVEEPAFMAADHGDETDSLLVQVPSVEDLLGDLVAPVAEAPVADAVASTFDVPAAVPPEPEEAIAPPAAESGVSEVDFERGLLGLGLGELPPEVAETPVEAVVPGYPESDLVSEPMSMRAEAPAAWVEEPETPAATPEELGAGLIDVEGLTGEPVVPVEPEPVLEIVPQASLEPVAEPLIQGEPDFSSLLQSLDIDAGMEEAAAAESAVAAGFDADLLLEVEAEGSGGVISTDAFLGDIGIGDMSFSGGLTDELSALTGADRRQPSRPQASVNAIPEEGAGTLQRDARVDKETVLKIIDGIKNL